MNNEPKANLSREHQPSERLHTRAQLTPAVDVFESKDELLVLADLPGVQKDDLAIHFDKGSLSLTAKRGERYEYARTFVVPSGIDADKITADLAQGVLKLRLPKSAALKPRTIAVTGS